MRPRDSTSIKSSPSVGPDALIALVRLLARQAAREFGLHSPGAIRPEPDRTGGSEMTDAPDFLRAGDIARLAGVSVRTVRRWIDEETLPSVKLRGVRLVGRKDLERALSPTPRTWSGAETEL